MCKPKLPEYNKSLAALFPEIAEELHQSMLSEPKPEELYPQSNKRLAWRCSLGHIYHASVQQRTKDKINCPECRYLGLLPEKLGLKRLTIKYNLATEYYNVAKELHPTLNGGILATQVSPKTSKIFSWQCERNPKHIWQTSVSNRTRLGSGCPYCFNQTSRGEIRVFTELNSIFPDAQHRYFDGDFELDIWIQNLQIGIEYDGAYWHSKCPDRDKAKVKYFEDKGIRLIRVRELPLRASRDLDISIRDPILKKNLNSVLAAILKITNLSSAEVREINEYYKASDFVNEQAYLSLLLGRGKPPLERSLASIPEVAQTWHQTLNSPLNPEDVFVGSNQYAWFSCAICIKPFKAKICKRVSQVHNNSKCKQCAMMLKGEKLLRDFDHKLFLELAPERNHEVDINELRTMSNKVVWWRCSKVKSHFWQATVAHRSNGTGCPYCSNRSIDSSNSLKALHPSLAARWDQVLNGDLKPDQVAPSSSRKVWWICPKNKNHSFEAYIFNMIRRPDACPYCSGKMVNFTNSLEALFPGIALQWHPILNDPLLPCQVPTQSGKKVWWQCPKNIGHVWQATVQRRVVRGTGCPDCRVRS